MIVSNKHKNIVEEFKKNSELSNNIKLLHYGSILFMSMNRLDCTLSELLNGINEASQQKIGDHDLGKSFL